MAQSNLKFSWGAEDSLPGNIINGKAYFATLNQYPLTSDTKAPEAFLYFDKDDVRYNVIAKRAISDALGNHIIDTYATKIMSSSNNMSIFAPGSDGTYDRLLGTANIINGLSIGTGTTHDGSTYHLHISVNGVTSKDYALAAANDSVAGIITTGAQAFGGIKTFVNNTESTSTNTGAVVVTGGVGIGGAINAGGNIGSGGSITAATSLTVGTTLSTGSDASIGHNLTVVGKHIYLGNIVNKITTLSSNDAGNVVSLGNANSTTFGLRLYNSDSQANENYIELDRGSDSSWKIVNDDSLRFQNNYTTEIVDYYDVLTLASNTGNGVLKGNFSADTITISNTDSAKHLAFSRTQALNYITAPTGGSIAFVVNGQNVETATSDLIISNGSVYPGETNATTLGKSNCNFSTVHARQFISADAVVINAAASKAITFRQNTTEVGSFDTTGSFKVTKSIYPAVNNSANSTLGKSTLYWNHTYSTNFTGTNFKGTNFIGTNFKGTNFNGTTFTGGTVYATTVGVYAGTSTSDRATFTYDKDTDTLTLNFA